MSSEIALLVLLAAVALISGLVMLVGWRGARKKPAVSNGTAGPLPKGTMLVRTDVLVAELTKAWKGLTQRTVRSLVADLVQPPAPRAQPAARTGIERAPEDETKVLSEPETRGR